MTKLWKIIKISMEMNRKDKIMNEDKLRRQIEIIMLERDEWRKAADNFEKSRDKWRKLYEQTLAIAVQAAGHE